MDFFFDFFFGFCFPRMTIGAGSASSPTYDYEVFPSFAAHSLRAWLAIELAMKRRTDGGKTWGKLKVVWDDDDNTCGNPCPVVDAKTGTVWMLMTHNLGGDTEAKINNGTAKGSRTVWVTKSDDDGDTW